MGCTRVGFMVLAASAVLCPSALRSQSWDFSYSYQTVFDSNADDYLALASNVQKVQESWAPISFWTPVQTGVPAIVRYRFTFVGPTTAIHLFALTTTYNYSLGVGDASIWGSVDGQQWTLIQDHPAPTTVIAESRTFDGLLPAALLGASEIWIEARMIRHSGGYPYGAAQFSREDLTNGRRVTFGLDANIQGTSTSYSTYRQSCPGSAGTPVLSLIHPPRMGETFHIQITGLLPHSYGFLCFTLDDRWWMHNPNLPLPIDLIVVGAPGCFVNVDTAHRNATMMTLLDVVGNGTIDVRVGVPISPLVLGFQFYNQFISIDPTANSLGLATTNAGRGVVGF